MRRQVNWLRRVIFLSRHLIAPLSDLGKSVLVFSVHISDQSPVVLKPVDPGLHGPGRKLGVMLFIVVSAVGLPLVWRVNGANRFTHLLVGVGLNLTRPELGLEAWASRRHGLVRLFEAVRQILGLLVWLDAAASRTRVSILDRHAAAQGHFLLLVRLLRFFVLMHKVFVLDVGLLPVPI